MFHIIKTGQQKSELHYVDFGSKKVGGGGGGTISPPPLLMRPNGPFGAGGTGSKRHFVKVNEETFVREVRKRPILYNTTLKDYKRFSTRHEAWAEVAVAMRLSEQECKKRWRSMRDAFMKVVRNRNEEERKSWIHYRLLEFLLPFVEGVVGRKGAKRLRSTESTTSQTVDYIDGYGGEDDDAEFVELDEDMEIYEGSGRDPITVSYVTEDGKEVFQMLQDPDTIPEGAVIGIEESEVEDEIDEDEHEHELLNLNSSVVQQQLGDQIGIPHQHEEHDDNFIYEDRINSAMLDTQPSYEPVSGQSLVEQMKREALSDGEGSEIQVEEIDMDLLLSSNHQPDNDSCPSAPQPQPEPIIETIPPPPQLPPVAIPPTPPETVTSTGQSTPQRTQTPAPAPAPPPPAALTREPPDSSRSSSASCAGDSDERFLLSCVPILQRLPNKKNQLARLKIQQLLFELEYDEKYSS
uniref:Putative alcohol dehydrogenase transcription factor myb/sant-like protein n=1 Tax=Culex tarsalis TaxID=7177 RepID=A0A1Q3G103_CULTA